MLLSDLVACYRLEREVKDSSVQQLSCTVSLLTQYLGRPATLDDLNDDTINRWVEWMTITPSKRGGHRSRSTVATQRNNAVLIWNYAWESERIDRQPRRVRKVKRPRTLPEAWTEKQMAQWLAGCSQITGMVAACQAPAKLVIRCYSLLAWDTAARTCDLLKLKRSEISSEGAVVIYQEKTGYPVLCRLRPETMAAVDELCRLSGKDTILPFKRETLLRHWNKVKAVTGLDGTPKKIRKSRATSAEQRDRGSAPVILGHVPGSTIAYRHYVDRLQILPDPGLPPAIDRRQDIA